MLICTCLVIFTILNSVFKVFVMIYAEKKLIKTTQRMSLVICSLCSFSAYNLGSVMKTWRDSETL